MLLYRLYRHDELSFHEPGYGIADLAMDFSYPANDPRYEDWIAVAIGQPVSAQKSNPGIFLRVPAPDNLQCPVNRAMHGPFAGAIENFNLNPGQ